jgi:hypothetical protein
VISATFKVIPADKSIRNLTLKINNQEYTGKPITIDSMDQIATDKSGNYQAFIKNGKDIVYLQYGKDFVFDDYKNNTALGTATLTVRGIGQYGGTTTATFKITSRLIEKWWKGLFH